MVITQFSPLASGIRIYRQGALIGYVVWINTETRQYEQRLPDGTVVQDVYDTIETPFGKG